MTHAPPPRPGGARLPDEGTPRVTTLAALMRDTAADLRTAEPPESLRRTVLAHHRVASGRGARAGQTALAGLRLASAGGALAGTGSDPRGSADAARRSFVQWLLTGLALIAVLLLAAHIGRGLMPPGSLQPPPWRGGPAASFPGDGHFVPVGAGLSRLGADGHAVAWLVPTELPSDRLALLGLPFDPAQAGERVPAELLLDAGGNVLAVRVGGGRGASVDLAPSSVDLSAADPAASHHRPPGAQP